MHDTVTITYIFMVCVTIFSIVMTLGLSFMTLMIAYTVLERWMDKKQ